MKQTARAVALALLHLGAASAQEAAAPAASTDGLKMERIVVTGTPIGSSKMKSSVSVSTLEADAIQNLAPTGAAEVPRAIPGLRSESSGDDANTLGLPGYTVVHAFLNTQLTPKVQLSLNANNLFNRIGYTEIEGDGHAARSITGRAVKASVKYAF
ncbi:MAG: hypothetical protein ACJ8HJ_30455 [Massilia sp.]